MSYHIYTTDAFVCGGYHNATSDMSVRFFTREFGMIYGIVKSAREERSRQRCAVQDFSHVRVSLIRGKAGWRVGSIEEKANHFYAATTRQKRIAVVSLYRFLIRYIRGEEQLQYVFDELVEAFSVISSSETDEQCKYLVEIVLYRLFTKLGYIAVSGKEYSFIEVESLKKLSLNTSFDIYNYVQRKNSEAHYASQL